MFFLLRGDPAFAWFSGAISPEGCFRLGRAGSRRHLFLSRALECPHGELDDLKVTGCQKRLMAAMCRPPCKGAETTEGSPWFVGRTQRDRIFDASRPYRLYELLGTLVNILVEEEAS